MSVVSVKEQRISGKLRLHKLLLYDKWHGRMFGVFVAPTLTWFSQKISEKTTVFFEATFKTFSTLLTCRKTLRSGNRWQQDGCRL